MKEQIYMQGIFFAMCCKMKKEGYSTINIDDNSINYYANNLEPLFKKYEYEDRIFKKNKNNDNHDNFKKFMIDALNNYKYGVFTEDLSKIVFIISDERIRLILKNTDKYMKLINNGVSVLKEVNNKENIDVKEYLRKIY